MTSTVLTEALVVGAQHAEFGHEQRARVEIVVVERAGDGAPLGAPGAFEDFVADLVGVAAPVAGALVERQQTGEPREAIASDPAHGRRVRMDALRGRDTPTDRRRARGRARRA